MTKIELFYSKFCLASSGLNCELYFCFTTGAAGAGVGSFGFGSGSPLTFANSFSVRAFSSCSLANLCLRSNSSFAFFIRRCSSSVDWSELELELRRRFRFFFSFLDFFLC